MEYPGEAGFREGWPLTVSVSRSALRVLSAGLVGASALALAGCMGSPTYGTDKTANAQLLEDLGGALSIGTRNRASEIEYQPRPQLVRPETTAVLPSPQDNVTSTTEAGWPESPEQRLARIRKEATDNRENLAYRSPVVNDMRGVGPDNITPAQQAEFRRRMTESQGGSATNRRYLSEPPLTYRAPAATAPAGELGETEEKKERAAQREARKNRRAGQGAVGEAPVTR